ncbi:MAG: hypothetical protein JW863_11525 [Chitinispirillaceae bacterium]|nr:hypothetical protein [Chitinispirillaceae bacterium]
MTGKTPVWVAEVPDSPIRYVAVFNRNETPADVTIDFSSIGITAPDDTLRDLWEKKDIGVFSGSYEVTLAPHQSKIYRLTPPGATMVKRLPPTAAVAVHTGTFATGSVGGTIQVRSLRNVGDFSVSVFTPDGRLMSGKTGRDGTENIPVGGSGVYCVMVTYNGGAERHLVSRY